MKKLFRNILCPVSFDENSIATLDMACDLAQDKDATIYLILSSRRHPLRQAPFPWSHFPRPSMMPGPGSRNWPPRIWKAG